MKRRLVFLVLSAIMGVLFFGCGIQTLAQKNMARDVVILKKKVTSMEKKFGEQLNKTLKDAVKTLDEVDTNYKNSIETSLKNQASIASDLETIRIDFRRVKGNVEEIAHKADKNLIENKNTIDEYDKRLRDLELEVAKINGKLETLENNQKLFTNIYSKKSSDPSVVPHMTSVKPTGDAEGIIPVTATTAGTETATDTAAAVAATTVEGGDAPTAGGTEDTTETVEAAAATSDEVEKNIPEEAQKDFDIAYEVFKAASFDDAKDMFLEFIKAYPETEITDNAQYWVAECYYKKKEFDKAILEYDKMVANYPESDKVPSALLKEGFSFLQLEYKDEAIMKLKKLIEDYPDTNQAEIARRKLKVLQ